MTTGSGMKMGIINSALNLRIDSHPVLLGFYLQYND